MKMSLIRAMPLALLIPSMTTAAHAQTAVTDVVVMRRTVALPNPKPKPSPTPANSTPTPIPTTVAGATWVGGAITSDAPSCSPSAPATQAFTCKDTGGRDVGPSACASAKPSGATTIADYSTCTYTPVVGEWTDWSRQCGPATRTKTNSCLRQPLNQPVDTQTYCSIPATQTESKDMVAGCGTWRTTYGSCVAGKQSPIVECIDAGGAVVSEGMCSSATKPTPTFDTCQYVEDFENFAPGWAYPKMTGSTAGAHSGTFIMPMSTAGRNDTQVTASSTLVVGQTYYYTVWVRNAGATGTNTLQMLLYDGPKVLVNQMFSVTSTWEKHTVPFVATTKTAVVRLLQGGGNPGIQIDDVSVTLH